MLDIAFFLLTFQVFLVNTQQICRPLTDTTAQGICTDASNCRGSTLYAQVCELRACCVNKTEVPPTTTPECLNQTLFTQVYNTSRGAYIAQLLNYAIHKAGICNNCRAKAAFVAIAATMTNNFLHDEAIGTAASFSGDDRKFGNNVGGDGSRYRRRGLFGVRGKNLYDRFESIYSGYKIFQFPQLASDPIISAEIAALLWQNPTLQSSGHSPLTSFTDGSFYGLSMLWHKLTGGTENLPEIAKRYSFFLRLFQCGGDLFPGHGNHCRIDATTTGQCVPLCLTGMEDISDVCGCSGNTTATCPGAPDHIRCCADACSQELKMDLGLVLDSSGSITPEGYDSLKDFVRGLLNQTNVGENKTHVGIINYSDDSSILTYLNEKFGLADKLGIVNNATYLGGTTNTAAGLVDANVVFDETHGLRRPEEGVSQVIFVITDGESDNETATIEAASVLKQKGIHIVSVGVGQYLKQSELDAICTPPASENYFAIDDYAALNSRLSQFVSKSCSEPAVIPSNTTVTGEVGGGKYKYFKLKIVVKGNKVMIKVKLVIGKVKLYFSFTSRNPRDPNEFLNLFTTTAAPVTTTNAPVTTVGSTTGPPTMATSGSSASSIPVSTPTLGPQSTSNSFLAKLMNSMKNQGKTTEEDNFVTLVIDKPEDVENFDSVYVGVKGEENDNKFELTMEDCTVVFCPSSGTIANRLNLMIAFICLLLLIKF